MIYTLKIKLKGTQKPPIWRKVQVNSNISWDDLHFVIQALFNWSNSHMYRFSPLGYRSFPQLEYDYKDGFDSIPMSDPAIWPYGDRFDAQNILLYQYFSNLNRDTITYIYDFGDSWTHQIELSDVNENDLLIAPKCIDGKGKAPLEDIGGINGHYYFVDVINGPHTSERKEFLEWLGERKKYEWDEWEFDLKETNEWLRALWTASQKK